jgi:hypothetical protein
LPSFDPAVPLENSQVIRLQMPGGALALVGIPVAPDLADQPIVADIAVAQDGRPYAVRLVGFNK